MDSRRQKILKMAIILDASVALSWIIERSDPAEARHSIDVLRAIQADHAAVPSIWYIEVANGILVAERRGGLSAAASARFMALLSSLPINRDRHAIAFTQSESLRLARSFNLTAYDASYLELALRTGLPLATYDLQLASAAHSAGASLF